MIHVMSAGYQGQIEKDECPKCGGHNIRRLKRVTGYLSTDYRNFNRGKQDEVQHREKHNGIEIEDKK